MRIRNGRTRQLLIIVFLVVFSGCDILEDLGLVDGENGEEGATALNFDVTEPLRIIGASPVKIDPTTQTFVPACSAGESIEGMRISFTLKAALNEELVTQGIKDRLVREGDRVDGKMVTVGPDQAIQAERFTFGESNVLSTVQALDGTGTINPFREVQPREVSFTARTASRTSPASIALLIDHSGSMVGKVDPDRYFEVKNLGGSQPISQRTDQRGERFKAAGDYLIANLNSADRLIGWYFNETGLRLLCSSAYISDPATEPTPQEEGLCFTTDHWKYYERETGLGGITEVNNSTTNGRTPLWRAVQHAWDFLALNSPNDPKHIVVLTDSPDTCSVSGDFWIPDEPCLGAGGDVDYSAFRARVASTALDQRIPISIIQVQSRGYGSPDPAQMEISCLTGGTFQWVNNMDFALQGTKLSEALQNAYENVRDTIGGVWHLDVGLPILAEKGALSPGKVVALDGSVQLAGTDLLPGTASVSFVEAAPMSDEQDTRLLVRTTCQADSDCGVGDGACEAGCLLDGSGCVSTAENSKKFYPLMTDTECCCGVEEASITDPTFQCTYLSEPCCQNGNSLCKELLTF